MKKLILAPILISIPSARGKNLRSQKMSVLKTIVNSSFIGGEEICAVDERSNKMFSIVIPMVFPREIP
jgi:hypothetical protein